MDTYRAELMAQPAALAATAAALAADAALMAEVAARAARDRLQHVVITGMGGSYFAGLPLWLRLAAAGRPATLIDTAELLHSAPALLTPRALLVLISQSGETVEAVRLLERAGGRAPLVAVTNGRDNTVARAADYSLATAAGAERSVSGKSYVTSLLVLEALGRALTTGRPAPADLWPAPIAAVQGLLEQWEAVEAALAGAVGGCTPLYVLARGASLATAGAGALIIKEASRRPAEGMSAAQFRHGPLEMIAPGMGALLLAPAGATRPLILRLASELAGYGVATAVIGPPVPAPPAGVTWVATPPLDEWLAPLAEIVPLQILSHRLARDAGLEPGRFERMGKVTRSE
jgi:glucosamine--fructose-6-phosphate aminotransferase (isomerizing)